MTVRTLTKFSGRRSDFLLHFGLLFFLVLFIPYDLHLFQSLANGDFFSFENWFQLATYRTSFVSESLYAGTDIRGYYNWGVAFTFALIVTPFINRLLAKRSNTNSETLYYWLRVLLRYRLALAIVFLGIVKILPIQIPEPTLSELHTEYGDFILWKLYYLTNGIATAGYLPVVGALEILGGLFLLNRRTAVIGSGLLLAVLLNVVIVNYVYELGEQVYSSFLFLLALVIFLYDFPRFYSLLVLKQRTVYPDGYRPTYSFLVARWRPFLQAFFLLLIAIFSVQAYTYWKQTNYPFPEEKGIPGIAGVYDVKDFVWKGDTIAYGFDDPVRWKDVVFEEWNTLSVRDNSPVKVDSLKPRIAFSKNRNYESAGNAGRHFYRYTYKKDKGKDNTLLKVTGKTDSTAFFQFSYKKLGVDTILLSGINNAGDSLNVRLERIQKKYLLKEGRRNPIQIY
ncbi:beta-carotene 15,15'-monooxygenase [Sphingobacterium sp. LRF_L2]|uniref:beta-carotene 15,15'-monooxygenase n=1 Tax=Sphingobacterium sp. LRF_L2 TaxID=3369421 RepID=UPI003F5F9C03